MTYEKHILIGRIKKIHGYQGSVTATRNRSFTDDLPEEGWVFIEIDGKLVPFFIAGMEYSGADLIRLKFDGYDSAEKVSGLTGCNIFLDSGRPEKRIPDGLENLKGIKVLTREKQSVGVIKEVIIGPGQWLLSIISDDNKEILIPLHEDLIIQLDQEKGILIMDLPDGLTEVNF